MSTILINLFYRLMTCPRAPPGTAALLFCWPAASGWDQCEWRRLPTLQSTRVQLADACSLERLATRINPSREACWELARVADCWISQGPAFLYQHHIKRIGRTQAWKFKHTKSRRRRIRIQSSLASPIPSQYRLPETLWWLVLSIR